LTSMFPKAGGVYEFCKQAYGRFPSFLMGWITILAGNITIAMLIVGGIQYLLPIHVPFFKTALSLLFVFLFNYIAFKGMKTSAVMLVTFACITIATPIVLIFMGFIHFDPTNFSPFFVFPASSILITTFLIAETFFGWESATFLAAETKDGAKVMPKALVIGTVCIAVLSLLLVVTSLGTIPWQQFGESASPLSDLGQAHFGRLGLDIFTILVYISIIGSVAAWIVAAPRLLLSMAEDKLFPVQFAKIHPKYNTPYKAIIFQAVLTTILVLIGSGSYSTLLGLLVPMVLVMYSFVLMSVVILRYRKPDLTRWFRAPLGKIGPAIVVLFMLFLLVMWAIETGGALQIIALGISMMVVGFPLYLLVELYYDPKVIIKVNDLLAYIALVTERINLPKKVRQELVALLGDVKGKHVLEYGCNVGTLTMLLAEEVTPKGKVYATEQSAHQLAITRRRIEKKGHMHVTLLQDKPHKVHPKIPRIDTVVSVGMIGSIEVEEQILSQLNQRLNKGARIVFLDYDKFYDVIPNIDWLSEDRKIKAVFRKEGFDVDVVRKQGFAWQYIYIFGRKVKEVKVSKK
ncbi:amino acid permease, partial [Candidatus Woesearchaeota archaeon]|nr:amino acid permease [Candidatus Woesearchaeota archaeon]